MVAVAIVLAPGVPLFGLSGGEERFPNMVRGLIGLCSVVDHHLERRETQEIERGETPACALPSRPRPPGFQV